MKRVASILMLVAGLLAAGAFLAPVFAASDNSTVDVGGQRTTSANYTMDGSLGGIGDAAVRGRDLA